MPALERSGDVFVLDLGDGENRINPDWIAGVTDAIEEVAAQPAPRALVTRGSGSYFSAGLDLGWMAENDDDGLRELVADMHELLARMLELPVPTVAAIHRHALAGGALFALAHDYRVMRGDRGWFCLPEVDGGIAFTPGTVDLVRARLAPQVAHGALTSGRRYGGSEALELGIVDRVCAEDEVLDEAIAVASALAGKDPATYGAIKAKLHRDTLATLRDREGSTADVESFRALIALLG